MESLLLTIKKKKKNSFKQILLSTESRINNIYVNKVLIIYMCLVFTEV